MTGRRSRLLAVTLLGALIATWPAAAAARPLHAHRLFTLRDPAIFEASDVVDRGSIVFTTNDSGDKAVVYGVDPHTGRTVSRTTYAPSVIDVESLAPGSHGTLWAGDTGDNLRDRDDIAVYHVRPGSSRPAPRAALTYPDGSHDAETLLVEPRTQRVFVVSKSVFGGTVYAAPRVLRTGGPHNRMRAFAHVGGLVTDGTFFPDGRHVLLRTYGTASVYTFPGFALVGTVRLPSQPQGEGISVSSTGRVLLTSEGVDSAVLQVRLPARLTRPRAAGSPSGPQPSTKVPHPVVKADPEPRTARDWVGIGAVVAVVAGLVVLVVRTAPLPRSRGR